MKLIIDFFKKFPIITAIIAVALGYGATQILAPSDGSTLKMLYVRVLLVFTSCAFLYLISGDKTFKSCTKTTGNVFKHGWFLLIVPLIFGLIMPFFSIATGAKLRDDWPLELLLKILLYLFVGIFEETTFRAIINDALLRRFRNVKGIFVIIAIVSSVVFGALHVLGANLTQEDSLVMAIMKTVSAGLFGLCLLFLYWKTRNLWAIALIHGINDLLADISSALFVSENKEVLTGAARYTTTTNLGTSVVGFAVQIAINVVFVIILYFKVAKKTDFKEIRENW